MAFLRGVDEYNNYGAALSNPQLQVGREAALELYGFKVARGQTKKKSLICFNPS